MNGLWKYGELRPGPVFPGQILDPAKFPRIGGDQRQSMTERLPGDQQIILADGPSDGLHLCADLPGKVSVFIVECEVLHRAT